jgi:pimeloyl-ACP methyl ester carboxylesterase
MIITLRVRRVSALLAAVWMAATLAAAQTRDAASADKPVKAIADHTLQVKTAKGTGTLPLYVSIDGNTADLSHPQPGVVRALIVFHGKQRNADDYNQSGLKAIRTAGEAGKGTLLLTPQFLETVDTNQFHLPPSVLRWGPEQWMAGDDALDTPVSSFDAIDAMVLQLADRTLFPNLKSLVIAGHSGGGQVVQRYAVAGRAGDTLMRAGVHVRYVIANPSSYVYFSPERPVLDPKGKFTFALPAKTCFGRYDRWKYGVNDPPPYLSGADFGALEQRFLRRDVLYLLGTNDVDPNHPALDKTCSGEDEGPYRFFRGKAYFRYLEDRHPELSQASASQQLWFVPGVEHDGDKMLNSTCGLAALFGVGTCTSRELDPKP